MKMGTMFKIYRFKLNRMQQNKIFAAKLLFRVDVVDKEFLVRSK